MQRKSLVSEVVAILIVVAGCAEPGDDRQGGPSDLRDAGSPASDTGLADSGSADAGPMDTSVASGRLRVAQNGRELVAGDRLRFGRILIDSRGASFGLDLINVGPGALQVATPTIAGDAAADYRIEPFEAVALPPTSSVSLTVTFRPTDSSTRAAELRLVSDDPVAPTYEIALEGVGVSLDDLPADTNGDWSAPTFVAYDTRESRIVVRVGDIDNLGFGWPANFDPFSGRSTPRHPYPWTPDPADPEGTDRIMVVSSYDGQPPRGRDGYTTTTSRPGNLPAPVTLDFDLRGSRPYSAVLQMFVDDFQAPVWGAQYRATFDGVPAPVLEEVLATLNQTGPIGKLITVPMPAEQLYLLDDGRLEIEIDDPTTGAGDGFAIDFVKLFIDVYGFTNVGVIQGAVTDVMTGQPVSAATVSASGFVSALTDAGGGYRLNDVPAGFVYLRVAAPGYASFQQLIDLRAGQTVTRDVALAPE